MTPVVTASPYKVKIWRKNHIRNSITTKMSTNGLDFSLCWAISSRPVGHKTRVLWNVVYWTDWRNGLNVILPLTMWLTLTLTVHDERYYHVTFMYISNYVHITVWLHRRLHKTAYSSKHIKRWIHVPCRRQTLRRFKSNLKCTQLNTVHSVFEHESNIQMTSRTSISCRPRDAHTHPRDTSGEFSDLWPVLHFVYWVFCCANCFRLVPFFVLSGTGRQARGIALHTFFCFFSFLF